MYTPSGVVSGSVGAHVAAAGEKQSVSGWCHGCLCLCANTFISPHQLPTSYASGKFGGGGGVDEDAAASGDLC